MGKNCVMGGCIPDGVRVTGVQSSHPNALDLHPLILLQAAYLCQQLKIWQRARHQHLPARV